MELTKELIYNEYKEYLKARKYWLIFLIMCPIFLLIGALGGSIEIGIFISAIMVIYMICSSISSNKALKKIKNDGFILKCDVVIDKAKYRSHKNNTTRHYIKSQKFYQKNFEVFPSVYDALEIGDEFAAVYVGKKLIKIYALKDHPINAELYSKVVS